MKKGFPNQYLHMPSFHDKRQHFSVTMQQLLFEANAVPLCFNVITTLLALESAARARNRYIPMMGVNEYAIPSLAFLPVCTLRKFIGLK